MQSKNDTKKLRSDAIRAAFTARDHRRRKVLLAIALAFSSAAFTTPAASLAAEPSAQATVVVPVHPLLYGFHKITLQERVVEEAKKYIGIDYVPYASDPKVGFDCSGFTMYVYSKFGIHLPHSASAQLEVGIPVSEAKAVPGDLVKMVGHVGIWMGHGMMLDAPRSGETVGIRPIWADDYTIFKVRA